MPLFSFSIFQYLLAIVSASIIHKLTVNRFFLSWLTSHKFETFVSPTNNELRQLQDCPGSNQIRSKTRNKSRFKRNLRLNQCDDGSSPDSFKISTSDLTNLKLNKTIIHVNDIEHIKYSVDLEWVVDLALLSLFCLVITDVLFHFYPPTNEYNFSIIWAFLVVLYCNKILWSLTAIYFKSIHSVGERSICIVSASVFLTIAMIILTLSEEYLDFGCGKASMQQFGNQNIKLEYGLISEEPLPRFLVKLATAVLCSLVGVTFTFPGLRFGQLHQSVLNDPDHSWLSQVFHGINYLGCLFMVCLWIKPISRDFLVGQDMIKIDNGTFDIWRIYTVLIVNLVRFSMLPKYIRIFLLSTVDSRLRRLKIRGGYTTNREIQITISSIYKFFNIIVIQYTLPIILCFFTAIIYYFSHQKLTQSTNSLMELGFKWSDIVMDVNNQIDEANSVNTGIEASNPNNSVPTITEVDLEKLKTLLWIESIKCMFSFSTWWLHFAWFCTSTAGMIYHKYFIH